MDPRLGKLERLDLTPALATPVCEQAIRARAAYLANLPGHPLGRVMRVTRNGETLSVFSEVLEGVCLSELLAGLEFKTVALSGEELLELASSVVNALATMHERLPSMAHGALMPAHIVLRPDGSTVLTGAVYGDALQALESNREHLWKEFGLALPSAASFPRFDQRGDVTQLGAVVLAIAERRSLRRDEHPRGTPELAASATVSDDAPTNTKLRLWLQDTLLIHGRVVFGSAVDAARAFNHILPPAADRTLESLALQTAIRQIAAEAALSPEAPKAPKVLSHLRAS